jgi:protocatechuate 3,4-dioxygenase beta subunit
MGLPFYGATPILNPEIANSNLTYNPSNDKKATGEIVKLNGRITNRNLSPLSNASIELWNTNTYGSYVVEDSPKGIDKGFVGYGKVQTNENGEFEFITIKPIAYTRYGFLINRPPHFHFLVTHPKIKPLGLEVDIVESPNLIQPCENKVYLEATGNTEIKFHGVINIKVKEFES